MNRKQIATAMTLTLVTLVVFGWSVVMTAMGHAPVIAAVAPVLGLTVIQVMRGTRPQTAPTPNPRTQDRPSKEDDAP